MSGLIINISKLSAGHHHRSLETQPADVGLDARFNRTIRVEATLEKSNRQLFIRVQCTSGGLFTCDRCLDEFQREIATGYSMMYVTDDRPAERLESEAEIQILSPDTNMIDIGEDVRQYALLSLSQKSLCREECAGLCPSCGVNKNKTTCTCPQDEIDPRWSVLRQVLKN